MISKNNYISLISQVLAQMIEGAGYSAGPAIGSVLFRVESLIQAAKTLTI